MESAQVNNTVCLQPSPPGVCSRGNEGLERGCDWPNGTQLRKNSPQDHSPGQGGWDPWGLRSGRSSDPNSLGRKDSARSEQADARNKAVACLHINSTLSLCLRTSHAKGKSDLRVWKKILEGRGRLVLGLLQGSLGRSGEGQWWPLLRDGRRGN